MVCAAILILSTGAANLVGSPNSRAHCLLDVMGSTDTNFPCWCMPALKGDVIISCYRPLYGKFDGYEAGKARYKVLASTGVPAEWPDINIPCGHCIGCRLDKSRQWADRMMLELDHSKTAIFLTLTYDDFNVPVACVLDDRERTPLLSLRKRDVQLFMKRLRKAFTGREIRFYLAGEYGTNTHRPHYHAILFGLSLADFPDIQPICQNSFGQFLYKSDAMYSIWKLGHVVLADVSWQTCAYVARYCVKKQTGDVSRETFESFGVEPEFSLMSRRPGIAGFYAIEHPDLISNSKQYFSDVNGASPRTSCPTPKFVFQKLELTNPELYDKIKSQRQIYARDKELIALSRTDLDFWEYDRVKEYNHEKRSSVLNDRDESRFY